MMNSDSPVGEKNDFWIKKLAQESKTIVAAWGNHGSFMNRSKDIKEMIPNLYRLSINNSGEPAHPLYLKSNLTPKKFMT
jgi:hypothetical protein